RIWQADGDQAPDASTQAPSRDGRGSDVGPRQRGDRIVRTPAAARRTELSRQPATGPTPPWQGRFLKRADPPVRSRLSGHDVHQSPPIKRKMGDDAALF